MITDSREFIRRNVVCVELLDGRRCQSRGLGPAVNGDADARYLVDSWSVSTAISDLNAELIILLVVVSKFQVHGARVWIND
jgi:hypothetical protein